MDEIGMSGGLRRRMMEMSLLGEMGVCGGCGCVVRSSIAIII
jgi:hypothetical protein